MKPGKYAMIEVDNFSPALKIPVERTVPSFLTNIVPTTPSILNFVEDSRPNLNNFLVQPETEAEDQKLTTLNGSCQPLLWSLTNTEIISSSQELLRFYQGQFVARQVNEIEVLRELQTKVGELLLLVETSTVLS